MPSEISSPPSPLLPTRLEELDDNAPQLPARTAEMLEEVNPEQKTNKNTSPTIASALMSTIGKTKARLWRRSKHSSSPERSSTCTSPSHSITSPTRRIPSDSLPPIPLSFQEISSVPTDRSPRAEFVNMKTRPLPIEPFASEESYLSDDDHEYEMFDFEHQAKASHSSFDSGVVHSVRHTKEQWQLNPPTSKNVYPSSKFDPTKSLPASSSIKKSRTFNGNDKKVRPNLSKAPIKFSKEAWPMYVDGYVNTDHPPRGYEEPESQSIQDRQLPPIPFAQGNQKPSADNFEYDYPFMNTLPLSGKMSLPSRKMGEAKSRMPIPPRFPPSQDHPPVAMDNDEDADDYIHMQVQHDPDIYINSETIEQLQNQFSTKTNNPPSGQFSHDDMYMNLPGPSPVTTPISTLPRRTRATTSMQVTPIEEHPPLPATVEEETMYINVDREAEDELDYINVTESLPASLLKHAGGLTPPPPLPNKQPVNTPIISLPPRNIKRFIKNSE